MKKIIITENQFKKFLYLTEITDFSASDLDTTNEYQDGVTTEPTMITGPDGEKDEEFVNPTRADSIQSKLTRYSGIGLNGTCGRGV